MAGDGWETVTDPSELKKVLGTAGMNKVLGVTGGGKPAGGPRGMTADQASKANIRAQNLLALGAKFADVQRRYNRDLKGVGLSSLMEYLPLPQNRAFDSAAAGLSDVSQAVFKVPGMGSQSDADLAAFIRANQPSASDSDAQIEAKLSNIRNRIEKAGGKIPGDRAGQFKVIR